MKMLIVKYLVTALVVVLVSEIARRSGKAGALVASLPIVTIMVMIWLQVERQPTQKISNHAYFTFWYVLPTLPMFLFMPALLNRQVNFWIALLACIVLTVICFFGLALITRRFGLELMP